MITRENKGAVRTRRDLFEAASGEWIWIIDSDDMIADDAVSSLLSFIRGHECDMVLFDHYTVSENETKLCRQTEAADGSVFEGEGKRFLYRLIMEGASLNTLWNKIFKRSCIDFSVDYSDYEDIIKGNDCFQMIPIVTNARRIIYLQRPYYYYNMNNTSSLSHRFNERTYTSLKKVWERRRSFVRQWGMEDEMNASCNVSASNVALGLLEKSASYCERNKDFYDFFFKMMSDGVFSEAIDRADTNAFSGYRRLLLKKAKKRQAKRAGFLIRLRRSARRITRKKR